MDEIVVPLAGGSMVREVAESGVVVLAGVETDWGVRDVGA
jgi:hypothetical protein